MVFAGVSREEWVVSSDSGASEKPGKAVCVGHWG